MPTIDWVLLDLARPTRGRILAAFTAACLQTHLAFRQKKREIIIQVMLDIPTVVLRTGKRVTIKNVNSVKDAEMGFINLQVGCIARRHLQSGVPGAPLLPCSA